jgi:ParB/RepB/Spo0J family partition protein
MAKTKTKRTDNGKLDGPKHPSKSNEPGTPFRTQIIAIGQITPNEYNPNRMSQDEFAELVAEVKHLGRLPKPVVVRPNGQGFLIVDGEHGWRAAQKVGLAEIPCEVIDADDFEAMRQTYKRNQHGTHEPIKLGRMFQRMMEDRKLSQRDLAKEIAVSEGTVRNALEYAKAEDVRNSYADNHRQRCPEVAELSLRQVRLFNRLPPTVARLWLIAQADVKALWSLAGVKTEDQIAEAEQSGCDLFAHYRQLEDTGLFEYIRTVWSPESFVEAVQKVRRWSRWEEDWYVGDLREEQLRPYTKHYFRGCWYVREKWLMDAVLDILIDTNSEPPRFLLSPEEVDSSLQECKAAGKQSHQDFMNRLVLHIANKTGKMPDRGCDVKEKLMLKEIELGAPDYIRESSLPVGTRYAIWREEGPEQIKRQLAASQSFRHNGDVREAIKDRIRCEERQQEIRATYDAKTCEELAEELAGWFPIYDSEKDAEAIGVLAQKLAQLTKGELLFLREYCRHMLHMEALAASIRRLR